MCFQFDNQKPVLFCVLYSLKPYGMHASAQMELVKQYIQFIVATILVNSACILDAYIQLFFITVIHILYLDLLEFSMKPWKYVHISYSNIESVQAVAFLSCEIDLYMPKGDNDDYDDDNEDFPQLHYKGQDI